VVTSLRHSDPANDYLLAAIPAVVAGRPVPQPPAGVDWRARAAQHGVLALLDAAGAGTGGPPSHRFSVAAQLEVAMRDLATVATALDAAALRWAVVKGPVLGYEVYGDPLARWFTDLDVVVAPQDFGDALTALERSGGVLLDRNWPQARRLRLSELTVRMPRGTAVDLHWHVVSRADQRDRMPISTQDLLTRTRTVHLGGLAVPTFAELDTVLHLAVHGAVSGGGLLRWLVDLSRAVHRYDPDPGALGARARSLGCALAAQLMVDRAARYVDPALHRYHGRLAPRSPAVAAGRVWSWGFPPGRGLQDRPARSGEALYLTVGGRGPGTAGALMTRAAHAGRHWWFHPERRPMRDEAAHQGAEMRRVVDDGGAARLHYLADLCHAETEHSRTAGHATTHA
jgi:hypothetical protein